LAPLAEPRLKKHKEAIIRRGKIAEMTWLVAHETVQTVKRVLSIYAEDATIF